MSNESIFALLDQMQLQGASDLYLTYGAPPMLRITDRLVPASDTSLSDDEIARHAEQIIPHDKLVEFDKAFELNAAFHYNETSRFRVNMYRQQGHTALVIRRIQMQIPTLQELGLPPTYAHAALNKRGLILIAGPTGSGKSTSLAAMVGHRNLHGNGHIITVEDPIEFIHRHGQCIISQRDVGLDTHSYGTALKHALRQQPDMVVIGEVRDLEVMEQAIYFAETSHLCIATIHANNSSQAIERILNFFPEERYSQVLMNLSLNLRAVFSQRLVHNLGGTKSLAMEVMVNQGLIRQLIAEGKIPQIREMIEKGASDGMQTFDQSLFELHKAGVISEEVAIDEADSPSNLRILLNNHRRGVVGIQHDVAKNMMLKPQQPPANDSSF
jgi:twitching motility protein PilU